MSQPQDPDLVKAQAAIALGMDAKVFMGSQIGRYLTKRANDDIEAAMQGLSTVDPTDPEAIRKLQNEIKVASNFLQWMGELVTEGELAEQAFIERQD